MISSDYHVHTSFSTDSDTHPKEVINAAAEKGLKTLCITDHIDYDYPEDSELFVFNPEEYFDTLNKLRNDFAEKIDLRIGVELGLRNEPDIFPSMIERYDELIKNPFDFVIGSTHIYGYGDPYYSKYWEDKDPHKVISDYYEATLFNAANYNCFDVYGHLDYIIRYKPDGFHYEQSQFNEIIREIIKVLIDKGKGLEINTSSLNKGFDAANPSTSILKMYREMGGEIITVGSDSHNPETLCTHFDVARDVLLECGFKYYTTFKNHKPEFIEL